MRRGGRILPRPGKPRILDKFCSYMRYSRSPHVTNIYKQNMRLYYYKIVTVFLWVWPVMPIRQFVVGEKNYGRGKCRGLKFMPQDIYLYSPVYGPAFRCVIGFHRPLFAVTKGGEPVWRNPHFYQKTQNGERPRRRKFPI